MSAVAKRQPIALAPVASVEDRNALVRKLILREGSDDEVRLVLALCDRYGLDPLLKHIVLVSNNVYVTRDGLLHIAHRSGQLDGILVTARRDGEWWVATCTVWRKDMGHPITYEAHQQEHQPKESGNRSAWAKYPRAMTIKCAEVACLRRAFNVSLTPAEEIGWDGESPHTSLGNATVVAPALGGRFGTIEGCLAYVADARRPADKREKVACQALALCNDLPGLVATYRELSQWIDTDGTRVERVYAGRYHALGGETVGGPEGGGDAGEEDAIDADFAEAFPQAGAGDETA